MQPFQQAAHHTTQRQQRVDTRDPKVEANQVQTAAHPTTAGVKASDRCPATGTHRGPLSTQTAKNFASASTPADALSQRARAVMTTVALLSRRTDRCAFLQLTRHQSIPNRDNTWGRTMEKGLPRGPIIPTIVILQIPTVKPHRWAVLRCCTHNNTIFHRRRLPPQQMWATMTIHPQCQRSKSHAEQPHHIIQMGCNDMR